MNKTKLEVINIDEDVIATSGALYTCETSPYHLFVSSINFSGNNESCMVFTTGNGLLIETVKDSNINDYNDVQPYLGNYQSGGAWLLDLGSNAEVQRFYYFDGSGWIKCSNDKNTQHLNQLSS